MAIKNINKEEIVFIPAYSGNREDSNPLSVIIHPLNRGEADKYSKRMRYFQRQGSKGEWDSNALDVQKKQFIDNVKDVKNFLDSETGQEIKDIEQFYEEAPHPLIEEILEAILDISQLKDYEVKNF
jgi:hypothetical protein